MPLPSITHLQFLVLNSLSDGELSGPDVRKVLESQGTKKSLPAFYQMMARLEDAGLVAGEYKTERIADTTIKIRWYRILSPGQKACEAVSLFYASQGLGVIGCVMV